MTRRCSLMTSSYLRTFLRISALRCSTVVWARSMALRDHLGLDGHVVGQRLVHHPVHGPGGEQPHQLVLEGQVEAALPGVALTAGAAAELVVDAAALVALGAEHVEATQLLDPLALGGGLGLVLGRSAPRAGRRPPARRGPGPRPGASRRASDSWLPPRMMSTPRPAMFVATVTECRRPAWATISASRVCCLAFRTSWRTPRFSSARDRRSDFSTDTVPTRQGWPTS